MTGITTSAKFFALSFLIVVNSGCVVFAPYVDTPDFSEITENKICAGKECFPNLTKALKKVEDARDATRSKRKQVVAGRATLELLIFGTAAAGTASAMYGASRDLVLGLGLGAAGSYAGTRLFLDENLVRVYLSGEQALQCVGEKASFFRSTLDSLYDEHFNGEDPFSDDERCGDGYDSLLQRYRKITENIKILQTHDTEAAHHVISALSRILTAINNRLKDREPSLSDIFNSGKGIGALASTITKVPGQEDGGNAAGQGEGGPGSDKFSKEACDLRKTEIDSATRRIETALDAVKEAIDTIHECEFIALDMTKFTASPKAFSLRKNEGIAIQFSGGKPPYNLSPVWIGTPPPDKVISFTTVLSTGLVIHRADKELPDSEYRFSISDSNGNIVEITLQKGAD